MSDGDGLEVTLTALRALGSGEVSLSFAVHRDDSQKIGHLIGMIGHQFMIGLAPINYDQPLAAPSQDGDAETPFPIASVSGKSQPSTDKRLVQQAAIMCNEPMFRLFLEKTFLPSNEINKCNTSDDAAEIVRHLCEVQSRSEIIVGTPAADRWDRLMGRFSAWERGMVA